MRKRSSKTSFKALNRENLILFGFGACGTGKDHGGGHCCECGAERIRHRQSAFPGLAHPMTVTPGMFRASSRIQLS